MKKKYLWLILILIAGLLTWQIITRGRQNKALTAFGPRLELRESQWRLLPRLS
jgi:hypothetical protein